MYFTIEFRVVTLSGVVGTEEAGRRFRSNLSN